MVPRQVSARRYDRAVTTTEENGSDAALGRAVMTNWEALARALVERFDGAVEDGPNVFRFRTGLHSGFLNGVLRADVPPDEVAAFAAEQRAWFPDGLPWRWVAGPGSAP